MTVARLVLPAVRRPPATGREGGTALGRAVEQALERGVGGFILFGGSAAEVAAWTRAVRAAAGRPLLLAADVERGAGQLFPGATSWPPAAALAAALDPQAAVRAAAEVTALEMRALGLNWALAPVADLDLEPRNPIVGTRSFGAEPVAVAECVWAWVEAAQAAGVIACAKHFPGHGRTAADSHLDLPVVTAGRGALEADWAPFRAAIEAGVASVMVAHVAYPALDPDLLPATLSRRVVTGLLRETFEFDGLVVSDALTMAGALKATGSEGEAAVRMLDAGVDLLLYPGDTDAVVRALEQALARGRLAETRVADALRRLDRALARVADPLPELAAMSWEEHGARALDVAERTVRWLRRPAPGGRAPRRIEVALVDDDRLALAPETLAALGLEAPPPPPSREPFLRAIADATGADVVLLEDAQPWTGADAAVVAAFADVRGFKGRAGPSPEAAAAIARRLRHRPDAVLVWFGHPRHLDAWPHARAVACAWSGDEVMQRAAARALARLWTEPGGAA